MLLRFMHTFQVTKFKPFFTILIAYQGHFRMNAGADIGTLLSPEAFNKDIIQQKAPTIHADFDTVIFQHTYEGAAGKLAALIRIENLWATISGRSISRPHNRCG